VEKRKTKEEINKALSALQRKKIIGWTERGKPKKGGGWWSGEEAGWVPAKIKEWEICGARGGQLKRETKNRVSAGTGRHSRSSLVQLFKRKERKDRKRGKAKGGWGIECGRGSK